MYVHVTRTNFGDEQRVCDALRQAGVTGRILAPDERVDGELRKVFPGLVFIETPEPYPDAAAKLDATLSAAGASRLFPLAQRDVTNVLEAEARSGATAEFKAGYAKGDRVMITNGAFVNYAGTVDTVIPEKAMVRVTITMFNQPTLLELEYWQVEKR